MNQYKSIYSIYDILYKVSLQEIKFYKKFVKLNSDILEMGCGTGRVSLGLAAVTRWKSYDCVDLSEEMLSVFQEKIDDRIKLCSKWKKLNLINQNMKEFRSDKKYDLIFYSFQSIQCLAKKDIEQQLKKSADMLKPKGHIVISFFELEDEINDGDETLNGCGYKEADFYWGVNKDYKITSDFIEYTQEVKNFRKRILQNVYSDDFKVANIDIDFVKEMNKRIPLKTAGIYSDYDKSSYSEKDRSIIVVYKNT